MASATDGSGTPTGKPTGFMSEYMSDLSQSQDLNSFLQKNKPTYNPNPPSSSTTTADHSAPDATPPPTASSSDSSGSSPTPKASPPSESNTNRESHPLLNGRSVYQKQAIQHAALDNCADYNMELSSCLTGKSGSWLDRASMCMKAKEQLQKCCRLNRDIMLEKGFASEGNTPEQDRAIQDYADESAQKAMKEDTTQR
ncbi:hypothetical protein B0O80DRAFT_496863 [Mortierella sp. GBAus27b]|nr:hypothetical protein BGX31_011273 [Mortierella sp. GBA43]KAI8357151.1 hypothetical protein B0O80DRAFT_496863 [Mortierella sp. GBAus27b]